MRLAMITLDEVDAVLGTLPKDPEAALVVARWQALKRVVQGVCVQHIPLFVTPDQEAALLSHCLRLAEEANNLAELLCPMETTGTRRAWSSLKVKLRTGVA